ncbi:glycosyl transferase [Ensifer adhaerens]|nr:glycosyl transferase [Ensifer adhaerens]
MKTISINGRFLTQPLTGVQRFAREMTRALDQRIASGAVPHALKGVRWRLLAPKAAVDDLDLKAISVERFGSGPGHVWEQGPLHWRARRDTLIGFGGSGPVLHGDQVVVIHDVTLFRHPASFGRGYRLFHGALGFLLARRAKIGTVSNFSRKELADVFRVPAPGIDVIYNATDHFADLQPDDGIIGRLGLADTPFFLLVGTLKPNKNVEFAVRAFETLGARDHKLVVVGGTDPNVFRDIAPTSKGDLIFPGRLTDAEIAGLQRRAVAFVFPSLYEGFGIPPLEAMTQGCPVLAADIPPVREACVDAVRYFDPLKTETLVEAMRMISADATLRRELTHAGYDNAKRFSWDGSAVALLNMLAASRA